MAPPMTVPDPRIAGQDEMQAEIAQTVEAGCRAVYGKNWDGPEDKRPGEAMKQVWRDLVVKAQKPFLAPDGPLAKLIAERDATIEELRRERDEAREVGTISYTRAEIAEGLLRESEKGQALLNWRSRAKAAESDRATAEAQATADAARVRELEGEVERRPIATAPCDGTVIQVWREGWKAGLAAYWGLAPMADSGRVANKRYPWVFLDPTNGCNALKDGEGGPTHWSPLTIGSTLTRPGGEDAIR